MRRGWLATVTVGVVLVVGAAQVPATERGARALERIRGLAGTWEGSYEWTGARSDKGALQANYYVTGNDSAVVENLVMGGKPSMTTVYHMDGPDLRMTHFCGAKNQPRLKASEFADDGATVRFTFVDATNLDVQPAHVKALEIRFLDADRITLRFTFDNKGVKSYESIQLKRVQDKA
jgi:hypothetical protein